MVDNGAPVGHSLLTAVTGNRWLTGAAIYSGLGARGPCPTYLLIMIFKIFLFWNYSPWPGVVGSRDGWDHLSDICVVMDHTMVLDIFLARRSAGLIRVYNTYNTLLPFLYVHI